jgi:hypothetical protein
VGEDLRWLNAPLGTLFSIELMSLWEEGSVVTTAYGADHWIFSTVWTPKDLYHPVSGNRQFGAVDNGNGTATFYTRAADRLSQRYLVYAGYLGLDIYERGGAVWLSFQNHLKSALGTSAVVHPAVIYRPKYEAISAVFSGASPVSSLDGCGTQ